MAKTASDWVYNQSVIELLRIKGAGGGGGGGGGTRTPCY